jgi:hypothetical protein
MKKVFSVGSELPILSLWGTFQYVTDAQAVLEAGMKKVGHKNWSLVPFLTPALEQWPRRIFKVPTLTGWEVVLTDPSVIDEVRKAPDSIMGADEAFENVRTSTSAHITMLNEDFQMFQAKWMFGAAIPVVAPYQILMVKGQLSRSLPQLIPELHEEAVLSFDQYIPATECKLSSLLLLSIAIYTRLFTAWASIKAFDTIKKIVTRTSNRAYVGVPLCKN